MMSIYFSNGVEMNGRSLRGSGAPYIGVLLCLLVSACEMGETEPLPAYLQDHSPTDQVAQGIVTGRYYEDMVADPELFFDVWYDMDIEWIRIEFEEFMNLTTLDYENPEVQSRRRMYEEIIELAHARGIKVLGIVGINSMPGQIFFEENAQGGQVIVGNGLQRYVDAVEWHITTYDVDAIEVWNEPRIFTFTEVGGALARLPEYARLLIETYTQLKPKYPDILFVAPATSNAVADTYIGAGRANPEYSIFNSDVMRAYRNANNGRLPLDVISWHPYGRTVAAGGGPLGDFSYGNTFAQYHAEVLGYRDADGRLVVGDYPIWLTEYGFEEAQTGGESNQREYYEDMIDAVTDFPAIEAIFWYTYFDDDPNAPGTQDFTYGMRAYDPPLYTPKESFYSFIGLSAGVGMRSDYNVVRAMVEYYIENGGKSRFGLPLDEVITSGGEQRQHFSGGSLGDITILSNGARVTHTAR